MSATFDYPRKYLALLDVGRLSDRMVVETVSDKEARSVALGRYKTRYPMLELHAHHVSIVPMQETQKGSLH